MDGNGLSAADIAGSKIQTFHYATRLDGRTPNSLDELD